ncbi:MAG: type IV secretion system DNA-binding domain-containing protein, partial [Candidatus Tectomicrobia bacterium]|nr:type IV secretion system DNA-binding domain-containing protein [Candidatus Tectomicrobia bacterium]
MQKELGYLIGALALSALAVAPLEGHPYPLDARLGPLATCAATAWCCVRLWAFLKARKRWGQWQRSRSWSVKAAWLPLESTNRWLPRGLAKALYRCLPEKVARWLYPDRGILLGRAFQWSPEHTQELETFMRERAAPLPTGTDMRGGYPALHAVGMKKERPLVLPWSELVGHVLIGGTTRSGKTRLLEVILSEAIRGPGTVIVIDPKGDAELLMRAASQARRMKRDFAFFSPAFPEQSSTFNPFSTCTTTTELASRVQALMPGGGAMARDPFFTEYPLAIIERLGAAQKAVGDIWTIESLNAVTTLVPPLEALIARYLYEVVLEGEDTLPPLGELVPAYEALGRRDLLADALLDDWGKPRDHFQKVTANLTPAFRGVTGDRMGPLLSSTEPELTWESIVEERKVVYFSMNSLMFSEVSNRIGRVILQDLIGFLGRRYAYDEPAKMTPVTILIDEFSNVAYPGFIDALNKGGGARANFMLAMQSLADPEAAMGRDGTQRVLDNLNTRIWFRLTDDKTAKLATEGLGLTHVSHAQIGYSLGFGGGRDHTASVGGGLQHTEKPLVRPEWLTGMPRGEALVRLKGENWKLRVPLLDAVSKKELREVGEAFKLGRVLVELKGDAPPSSPP